ncbi:MAG: TonB-dependent receptor domain-containing protein [Gemmatimonadaceae bacterium]
MRSWQRMRLAVATVRARYVLGVLAGVALSSTAGFAQTGSISGRVTDSASAQGIVGARVQAIGANNATTGVLSGANGGYRVSNLQPGTYTVQVSRIGFQMRRVPGVNVTAGGTATVDVPMTVIVTELNPVVTTASRREEKILEAPASIAVVDVRQIQERPSVTVADHVRSVPGVDVNQGGVMQSNIVARGFNNAFSGSILTLQDYRFASVPSLRVNVPYLFTGTNEDVERVEVLLGPASALYGPNSANGVLHVITKSPFTSQGTTLTIDGGTRSLFRGSARTAQMLGDKVGFKLSGDFFSAKEWEYDDQGEPDVFPAAAPPGRRGQRNARDFDLERASGEGRLDIRPREGIELVSTVGFTKLASGMEYTGANGTAQVKNWSYLSLQQRARIGRWFGQIFANMSNAGNDDSLDLSGTFLLRSGQPIVDKSRVFAAQLQHSYDFGSRQGFVYGFDWIKTEPRTGNTINGRNEDIDEVTEIGGYIQSTTHMHRMWDFIAALRLDKHDQIDGSQVSPRAALLFKPTATQNFRFTYNRAFQTPANFTLFLDLIQARNIQNSGYDIRALGNPPKRGHQFNRSCQNTVSGGLCMMSRFTGGNTFVNATANTAYPGLLGALAPQITQLLTASLGPQRAAAIATMLAGLRPTDAQVGTRITYLNNAAKPALDLAPAAVQDIGPLEASFNNTYELGYKGILGNRVRVAIDAWYQKRGDVGNPAGLATPSIFFNGQSLGAFIAPAIGAELVRQGIPPAQAQQLAPQIATQLVAGVTGVPGLAAIPLGIVQFNDTRFATATDIFATYTSSRNKEFDVQGIDMAADFAVNDVFTLATTYSWVSDLIFPDIVSSNTQPLTLNAPDNKATVSLRYNSEPRGIGYEVRGRYASDYPVNSGVYATDVGFPRPGATGTYSYEPVDVQAFLDLSFNWRLPIAGREAMWSIMGTNVLNNKARSFPGFPEIGAMFMTRIQYTF